MTRSNVMVVMYVTEYFIEKFSVIFLTSNIGKGGMTTRRDKATFLKSNIYFLIV